MQYPTLLATITAGWIAMTVVSTPVAHAKKTPPPATQAPAAPEATAPVETGKPLGAFELTYYWMAEERAPGKGAPLLHYKTCKPLAQVTPGFARRLALEGTGRLKDGRVINTAGKCKCTVDGARPKSCFFVVSKRKKWGVGVGKKPLSPFRTVAVDPRRVTIGTLLYIRELDGLTVPGRKPWGGFVHDGCVIAGDRGGNVQGAQIDFFVGRKRHYRAFFGRNRINKVSVFDGKGRCQKKGRSVTRAVRNAI